MNDSIMIAERLKTLRKKLGLNQNDFCKEIGIKQSTLSSYENGTVSPSNEVLFSIAKEYHISLDWLFGISDNMTNISTFGDIAAFLIQLGEINELKYELEINDHLPNDIETGENRWYAAIKFFGNDNDHPFNATMCNFLRSLSENRESFESYFTSKEMFDLWKEQKINNFSSILVTKKIYEELDNETRLKLRNEHFEKQLQDKQKNSETQNQSEPF